MKVRVAEVSQNYQGTKMRKDIIKKHQLRDRRKLRVRKALKGNSLKPRLCVIKSNKHIQVHLIDDEKGVTLSSISTFSKEFKGGEFGKKSKASGKELGKAIAGKAIDLGVKEVVFDRGYSKYHGILAEVADSAREAGLKF